MTMFRIHAIAAFALLTFALAQMDTGTTTFDLPGENVFPEGIAYHEASDAFFVSGAGSGALYRGDLETGEVEVFVPGDDRPPFTTIGLHADDQGRLWVAGGGSGNVYLFDIDSGELLSTLATPEAERIFLNDVVSSSEGGAYITDSQRPVLFRAAADGASVEPWLDLTGTPLEPGEADFAANGIVITEDDDYLIVIRSDTGGLVRIDTQTQEVSEIDLQGEAVTNGDGLVLDGQTLYVVRNADHEVTVVELSEDFTSGTVAERITDDSFAFPTTAAKVEDHLLVVNSQFNAMDDGEPELPFTVSRVAIP